MEVGDKVLWFGRDDLNKMLKNADVLEIEKVTGTVVKLTNGAVCDITSVYSIDNTCQALQEKIDELQTYIYQLSVLHGDEAEEYILEVDEDEEDTRSSLEKLTELEELTSMPIDLSLNCYSIVLCDYPISGLPKSVLTKIGKLGFTVVDGKICTN